MRIVLLALLATVPLAVPSSSYGDDGPTCLDRPATVVVDGEGEHGEATESDDVVVVLPDSGMWSVWGKGGDDVFCVASAGLDDFGDGSEARGGAGVDTLVVDPPEGSGVASLAVTEFEVLDVEMGAGGQLHLGAAANGTGTIDGGADAYLRLYAGTSIEADLGDRILSIDETAAYQLSGFARVFATAPTVVLDGDRRKNLLYGFACDLTAQGGRGDDRLFARRYPSACAHKQFRLEGQRGDDILRGTPYRDTLIGGPGKDVAYGSDGRDRCVAELEKRCER